MWILECDGDLFEGRRKWLKPGQKYLFGRTAGDALAGEKSYAISNKSVSRKHLVIAVNSVPLGQGNNLYEKSELFVTDSSKLGTYLDGVHFSNSTRSLSGKRHSIQLGSYNQVFRISWRPIVLTVSFTTKEQQTTSDILAPLRNRLEPFDIKTNLTYLALDTTHVVASKRNVPIGLQALINARYIVTEQFVDALVTACTSSGVAEDGSTLLPSPLEEDVDGNWPDALSCLPPSGKEPVPRPSQVYAPDPSRINIFEGFTFIFAEKRQFDSLSPVVMNGGAKAVKYDLRLGETKVEDFVQFVHDIAAQKGINDIQRNDTDQKVVIVRFSAKSDQEQWAIDFLQDLDLMLGQRSVQQNEFLDAILMNDSSPLHRYLLEEDIPQSPPALATEQHSSSAISGENNQQQQEISANGMQGAQRKPDDNTQTSAPKPRIRRGMAESKFKGFDDFDPSQIVRKSPQKDESAEMQDKRPKHYEKDQVQVDRTSLFVGESQLDTFANKRRRESVSHTANTANEELIDKLLPAAAAMKRRRLEERRDDGSESSTNSTSKANDQAERDSKGKQRKHKEIDVRSAARSHAEQLNKERRSRLAVSHAEESDDGMNPNEDISELRDLALVEEMEVSSRANQHQITTRSRGRDLNSAAENWDDRWNGMKNFKNFHRRNAQGQQESPGNRGRRVLVRLVEESQRDFGIGENYWLEPSSSSSRLRAENSGDGITPAPGSRTSGRRGEIADEEEGEEEEEANMLLEEAPRQSREERPGANGRGKGKRPVSGATGPARKRQRQAASGPQTIVQDEESSSDDDELKFRFRRRGR